MVYITSVRGLSYSLSRYWCSPWGRQQTLWGRGESVIRGMVLWICYEYTASHHASATVLSAPGIRCAALPRRPHGQCLRMSECMCPSERCWMITHTSAWSEGLCKKVTAWNSIGRIQMAIVEQVSSREIRMKIRAQTKWVLTLKKFEPHNFLNSGPNLHL